MGFFDDFKEDLSQAVGEINAAAEEGKAEGDQAFPESLEDGVQETLNLSEMIEKETESVTVQVSTTDI